MNKEFLILFVAIVAGFVWANDNARLRYYYCTTAPDSCLESNVWTTTGEPPVWNNDWNSEIVRKPTVRDLNSLPWLKCQYFFDMGGYTDGVWMVGRVPLTNFMVNSYQLSDAIAANRPPVVPVVVTNAPPTIDTNTPPVVTNTPPPEPTPQELYLLDLQKNGSQYVLENQYLILCDVLRQALGQEATQEKLGFEELPVMMLQLKAGSPENYEKLRDAMQMLNMALIRYDIRWWDTCVWHTQPELTNDVNKILLMMQ